MKLKATEGRTAPRDLYDIHFIARSKMEAFQGDDLQKLREFTSDTNGLLARYEAAFKEDAILCDADPVRIILDLAELAKRGPLGPSTLPVRPPSQAGNQATLDQQIQERQIQDDTPKP